MKRGVGRHRVNLDALADPATAPDSDLLELDDALDIDDLATGLLRAASPALSRGVVRGLTGVRLVDAPPTVLSAVELGPGGLRPGEANPTPPEAVIGASQPG